LALGAVGGGLAATGLGSYIGHKIQRSLQKNSETDRK
jgi:hypothetical protein